MGASAGTVDLDKIGEWLAALGVAGHGSDRVELLSGGGSGARSFHLHRSGGDLVLKVAPLDSPALVRERARREVGFYRQLADFVPVPVPHLVASADDPARDVLLLLGYTPPAPNPSRWSDADFVAVAETLARFHAAFHGLRAELDALPWLRRDPPLGADDIRRARTHWDRLADDPAYAAVLTPARLADLDRHLAWLLDDPPAASRLPVTLCHGDFHAGNLLRKPSGAWLIADWQEVGPGRGPEDLAFLVQRARFDGANVPADEMFRAYRRALEAATGTSPELDDIRRVADAAELRTRLLHWPAYLRGVPLEQVTAVLDRVDHLAAG